MVDDVFMSILPRDKKYNEYFIGGIPLRVLLSGGVDTSPDVSFDKVKLDNGKLHFHNNSGDGDSFTVTVMLHEDDNVFATNSTDYQFQFYSNDEWMELIDELEDVDYHSSIPYRFLNVITLLNYFIKHAVPFYVYTRAVGINQSDLYLITSNSSRKQDNDYGYVYWDLTFTRYNKVDLVKFENNNEGVTAAKKAYEKKKSNAKKSTAKTKTTIYQKLAKCDYKKLVYSKTKKTTSCIKTMQEILYKDGSLKGTKSTVVDGWFGDKTREAVKAYQRKYKKRDSLNVNGKVDKNTYNSLCGQVGKTKDITNKKNQVLTGSSTIPQVPTANNTIS